MAGKKKFSRIRTTQGEKREAHVDASKDIQTMRVAVLCGRELQKLGQSPVADIPYFPSSRYSVLLAKFVGSAITTIPYGDWINHPQAYGTLSTTKSRRPSLGPCSHPSCMFHRNFKSFQLVQPGSLPRGASCSPHEHVTVGLLPSRRL